MTRQIAIVNVSNWDGEDYRVTDIRNHEDMILKPGEFVTFTPDPEKPTFVPKFEAVDRGKPSPFYAPDIDLQKPGGRLTQRQVIPHLKIHFE